MAFEELIFNTTKQIKGGNRITGSLDAIFIRNRYQTELDNSYVAFVNMVHHIEDNERWKIVDFFHKAQGLKQDIESHQSERSHLCTELHNILSIDINYQKWMRTRTEKMATSVTRNLQTNIQRVDDSSEISIEAVTDFLKVNPEHVSTPSITNLFESIKNKEKEIRLKEETYNETVKLFTREIPYLESDLLRCNDKLNKYHSLLNEWYVKIDSLHYYKSIWFKILSEEQKSKILPDAISHRIEQFTHTFELFNKELSVYKTYKFPQLHTQQLDIGEKE